MIGPTARIRTRGHRGNADGRLVSARRTVESSVDLLTDKQQQRISEALIGDTHLEVEASSGPPPAPPGEPWFRGS
jgi:hypothetical protein